MAKAKQSDDKTLHRIAAVVFTLITLLHLWRLIYQVPARIGMWSPPLWLSLLAVVIAGSLALAFWKRA